MQKILSNPTYWATANNERLSHYIAEKNNSINIKHSGVLSEASQRIYPAGANLTRWAHSSLWGWHQLLFHGTDLQRGRMAPSNTITSCALTFPSRTKGVGARGEGSKPSRWRRRGITYLAWPWTKSGDAIDSWRIRDWPTWSGQEPRRIISLGYDALRHCDVKVVQ